MQLFMVLPPGMHHFLVSIVFYYCKWKAMDGINLAVSWLQGSWKALYHEFHHFLLSLPLNDFPEPSRHSSSLTVKRKHRWPSLLMEATPWMLRVDGCGALIQERPAWLLNLHPVIPPEKLSVKGKPTVPRAEAHLEQHRAFNDPAQQR